MAARATFLWGLKRSGIHLIANWLYANHGGVEHGELDTEGLHPQLCDGFADGAASVAFYNNCGRFHSRQFRIGDVAGADFQEALSRHATVIFGIEDCALDVAYRTGGIADRADVLLLRDPVNNLASRLEAATTRPELFRVDEAYVDLLESYCAEYLGLTAFVTPKVAVSFDRFVSDQAYRRSVAADLALDNVDAVSEVSRYGGGSSFSGLGELSPTSVLTRFEEHPIPRPLGEMLLDRPAVGEACRSVFGYDLATRLGGT